MRNITIENLNVPLIEEKPFEHVERKGVGHPDTLIDGIMEHASRALCKEYLHVYGKIMHHNVDKGLVVGGGTEVKFGGGRFTRPIDIILCGRACDDVEGKKIDAAGIAEEAALKYLKENMRFLDSSNTRIEKRISPGSKDLVDVFLRGPRIPFANDTSFGVGFAPLSETERIVYEAEQMLNSKEYKKKQPAVGEDIKVMGLRSGNHITLTVAIAFVSRFVNSLDEYVKIKEQVTKDVLATAKKFTERQVTVQINTGDDVKKGSVYLTVSGTSAEMGDDGEVGRGNRVNGLITPGRPMTMEAACGKNPVNHVGKIYSVLAFEIAEDIVNLYPDIEACNVSLLSAIGKPIDQPQSAGIQLFLSDGKEAQLPEMQGKVRGVVDEWLANVTKITELIVEGKVGVY
ncbi:S-adenosylmethionine synthase [Candidatus Burarchaeum australiense]|nr:S-adenosylmethionine synthase [Candidatus Burarchaeum australiense]